MARLNEVSFKHGRNLLFDLRLSEMRIPVGTDINGRSLRKKVDMVLNVAWGR